VAVLATDIGVYLGMMVKGVRGDLITERAVQQLAR